MLSIFLVQRTDKVGYDEHYGFVCIAETIDEVKSMKLTCLITSPEYVVITKIGTANEGAVKGIVLEDIHAG